MELVHRKGNSSAHSLQSRVHTQRPEHIRHYDTHEVAPRQARLHACRTFAMRVVKRLFEWRQIAAWLLEWTIKDVNRGLMIENAHWTFNRTSQSEYSRAIEGPWGECLRIRRRSEVDLCISSTSLRLIDSTMREDSVGESSTALTYSDSENSVKWKGTRLTETVRK